VSRERVQHILNPEYQQFHEPEMQFNPIRVHVRIILRAAVQRVRAIQPEHRQLHANPVQLIRLRQVLQHAQPIIHHRAHHRVVRIVLLQVQVIVRVAVVIAQEAVRVAVQAAVHHIVVQVVVVDRLKKNFQLFSL